jgi:hypothetical protein
VRSVRSGASGSFFEKLSCPAFILVLVLRHDQRSSRIFKTFVTKIKEFFALKYVHFPFYAGVEPTPT